MSDYLNKRGKILVALALTDSAQQELNCRSIQDAQQDLFESNIEHVQLDAKRDAESVILNKSGCTIEEQNESFRKCNKENAQPGDIITTAVSQSLDPEKLNKDVLTKNNVSGCINDNVSNCNIETVPMESQVEASIVSEGCYHSKNSVTSTKKRLVDYAIETDGEMDDFSAASDDDPSYQPHLETEVNISDISDLETEEGNVSNLTRHRSRNTESWKVNVTKKRRAECLPYKNKKKEFEAKSPKPVDCTKCRFQCTLYFTEEDRTALCKSYWGFADYKRQKDFLIKSVVAATPKRKRERSNVNRTVSKSYYLENTGGKHRVCANFFEKTKYFKWAYKYGPKGCKCNRMFLWIRQEGKKNGCVYLCTRVRSYTSLASLKNSF